MKILFIINSLNIGGAEMLVVELAKRLLDQGHNVELFLLDGKNTELLNRVQSLKNIKVTWSPHNSVYNPFHIFKIAGFLSDYDVIHVHLFPSLYWVAFAKIFKKNPATFVYTEHSTSNNRRGKWFFRLLDKFVYKKFDSIITIADEVRSNLTSHIGNKYPIVQIENGIDVLKFAKAKPYSKSLFYDEEDIILIQVSSFRYPKDQKTLLRALKRLPNKNKLLLVGEGPSKNESQELAKELGISDRVRFLGNRSDVPRLLKTADIILLSSFYEGLSLSSLEGMAAGKPFIASDSPGLRNIVGGAGLLFKAGDDIDLADQIIDITSNEQEYIKVAGNCLLRAKKYDINQTVMKYEQLYENLSK